MIITSTGIDLDRLSNLQKRFVNELLDNDMTLRSYPCDEEERELIEFGFAQEQQQGCVYKCTTTEKCKEFFATRRHLLVEDYSNLVEQTNTSCAGDTL